MTTTKFPIGQRVRFTGESVNIRTGAEGVVLRMDDVLTDCPVVQFPKFGDTFTAYSSFMFFKTDPGLEPIQ